jgi:UPF0716 protein FxsA
MVLILLLAMIGVPILEIAVFIEAGGAFGLWPTLAAVVATAIAGTILLRHQGLSTLSRVQASLEAGRIPMAGLFDGLCLLVAGALLLTPGFVTDGVGLLLFVPPLRAALRGYLARRLAAQGHIGAWHADVDADGTVIDGEFHEVRPDGDEPPPRIGS